MLTPTNNQQSAEGGGNEAELRRKLARERDTRRRQQLLKMLWRLTRASDAVPVTHVEETLNSVSEKTSTRLST